MSAWREVSNQKVTGLSLSLDVASVQMFPPATDEAIDGILNKSYEIFPMYESKKQNT